MGYIIRMCMFIYFTDLDTHMTILLYIFYVSIQKLIAIFMLFYYIYILLKNIVCVKREKNNNNMIINIAFILVAITNRCSAI